MASLRYYTGLPYFSDGLISLDARDGGRFFPLSGAAREDGRGVNGLIALEDGMAVSDGAIMEINGESVNLFARLVWSFLRVAGRMEMKVR